MNRRRLAAVLRVRELQERGARGELARNHQRHHRAVAVERHTWAQLDRRSDTSGTLTPADLASSRLVRQAGLLAAETQHAATEQAADGVAVARAEWTVAARRVEALERLADRFAEAEAAEDERRQNNELDDLVLARRGRGPDAGSGR